MSEKITSNALIYAILSISSEIELQKDYLNSADISDTEIKNEQEILTDMEQAFAEFITVYKNRRKHEPKLPDIDELLNNPL